MPSASAAAATRPAMRPPATAEARTWLIAAVSRMPSAFPAFPSCRNGTIAVPGLQISGLPRTVLAGRMPTMFEQETIVTTKHGRMPAFMACPDGAGPFPPVIFYMDAPGIREELRNMVRRIAKQGYVCLLPDMYYRLGTIRFDIPRRDDAMSGVIRAAMNSLSNALVTDDTAAMLAWFDAQDKARSGPVGCVGHCMSGCYITTVAARFPHRIKAAASLYGVNIVT